MAKVTREGQSLETRQVLSAFAVGSETLVNTTTLGNQRTGIPEVSASNPSDNSQAVALDADGDYVVVWQGETASGTGIFNIFGQRFSADGIKSGSEFQINSTSATGPSNNRSKPSVAIDSAGNFVVAWASGNGTSTDDIYARRFNASGVAVAAEFRVSEDPASGTAQFESKPTVAMSPAGEFVIAWESTQDVAGANAQNIFARAYDSAGSAKGSSFVVNSTLPGRQRNASAAMDGSGNFVIAWDSVAVSGTSQDGDDFGVYAQRYSSSGAAVGSEFLVNSATTGQQRSPSVGMDQAGDFVVVWHDNPSADSTAADVFGRRYASSGLAQGSAFRVNSTVSGTQRTAAVAMDSAGNFVVTWESNGNESGNYDIYLQSYNALGAVAGSELLVNTFQSGVQNNSAVSMDAAGDFVVVWTSAAKPVGVPDDSSDGVYSQRYHANRPPSAVQLTVASATLPDTTVTTPRIKMADITVTDDGYGTNALSLAAGGDSAFFEIDGNSLYLKAGVALNAVSKWTYSVTVQVDDVSVGVTPDATVGFTLNVIPGNQAPTAVLFSSTVPTLAENTSTASPVRVADISVTDDGNGANVLSLVGTDASSFEIVGGSLYVKAGVTLDFETKSSYSVTVQVDDSTVGATPDASTVFSLALSNVNEVPTAVTLSNTVPTLAENTSTASHIRVADISVVDDALGTNVLSLAGTDASLFEIFGGSLYVKAGATLDFETKSSYSVTVLVDDSTVGGNPDASTAFLLTLTDVFDGTSGSDAYVLTYAGVAPTGTVTVAVSTGGGPVSTLGVFSLSTPLTINGLGALDTVAIVGSGIDDTLETVSGSSFVINGASLSLSGSVDVGAVTLDGAGGNDIYRFDTDNALGTVRLRETIGGVDTLDFSATATLGITVNLSLTTQQIVNTRLRLFLNSATAFENVTGGDKNDILTGNEANNVLAGRAGNDTYLFDADVSLGSDTIIEGASGGTDLLDFSQTAADIVVNLSTSGPQPVNGNLSLTIPAGIVPLTLVSVPTIENVIGGSGHDSITGNSLANSFVGNSGNDTLTGGDGSDVFTGGLGNDSVVGGAGDDTYIMDADLLIGTDVIGEVNGAAGGFDTLDFSQTTTKDITVNLSTALTQEVVVSNLSIALSSATAFENVKGGTKINSLTGNSLGNTFTLGAGTYTVDGGAGDDIYLIDADLTGVKTIVEADGTAGGNDTLDFSLTTTRNVALDLSTSSEQQVTVQGFKVKLSSGDAFENVFGGSLNDVLTGNALSNILSGGAGSSTLTGGAGNDIYRIDADGTGAVTVVETGADIDALDFSLTTTKDVTASLGIATSQGVASGYSVILGSTTALENLVGGSKNDTLTGNTLANTIDGGPGNDTILWNASLAQGADTLNDVSGVDTISFAGTTSDVQFSLGATASQMISGNSLTLASATAFENVIGGSGHDTLTGNALANSLTGGAGNDTLTGAAGNDTYLYNSDLNFGADTLIDASGADTISFDGMTAAVTFSLSTAANTAQPVNGGSIIFATGSVFENLIGGSGNDTLTGNTGSNSLTGGMGNDTLTGGSGNDFYVFNADLSPGTDTLIDTAGIDTVSFAPSTTGVTFSLGIAGAQSGNGILLNSATAFENVIGGNGNDSLTGNSLANSLTGNGGNDTLNGSDGDDLLIGGTGNDLLSGGLNSDTYQFDADAALGSDTLADASGTDVLDFSLTTTLGLGISLDLAVTTTQVLNANLTLTIQAGTVLETVLGTAQDDVIFGNDADNVFVGNAGNDLLSGRLGRDILIGGQGADTLVGGDGDDLLIAGTTSHDTSVARLNIIHTEWISGNSFAVRTTNLRNGVGSPLTSLKAAAGVGKSVFTDGVGVVDVLDGGADNDWALKAIDDVFQGLAAEALDVL